MIFGFCCSDSSKIGFNYWIWQRKLLIVVELWRIESGINWKTLSIFAWLCTSTHSRFISMSYSAIKVSKRNYSGRKSVSKGSPPVRKVQFFWTLFKKPLTPPPFRLNIMWWIFHENFMLLNDLQYTPNLQHSFWTWVWSPPPPLFEQCSKKLHFSYGTASLTLYCKKK